MRIESTGWNMAALATPTTVPDMYMCSRPCMSLAPSAHEHYTNTTHDTHTTAPTRHTTAHVGGKRTRAESLLWVSASSRAATESVAAPLLASRCLLMVTELMMMVARRSHLLHTTNGMKIQLRLRNESSKA
jgi:hypothetical protein